MDVAPPELAQLARDWIAAGLARDVEFIARHSVTGDPSAVHTIASAPGANLTLANFLSHLGDLPPRYATDSEPQGLVHGDTAWLVDFPKIDMRAEGVFDARSTTVLVRVDGEWKVAHNHLSEGVPHHI